MKIKSLALLICAVLPSFSALAENSPVIQLAWQGNAYPAIMVKMKAAPSLTRKQLPMLLGLDDATLSVNAAFQRATARGVELRELQSLDAKYGFDRYLRITLAEDKTRDIAYINSIVTALKQNTNVETAYPESAPVSLDAGGQRNNIPKQHRVIDYRSLQYYTKGPQDIAASYTLGGVNRDSVNQYEGHDGSNVTLVSHELGMWNQNHINLPKAAFILGTAYDNAEMSEHDTASVGVMAATDMGAGVRGLAWNTHMAYAAAGSDQLYNAIPRLQAGDVVQIGFQVSGGQATGCISECYLPLESQQAYFDVIKALTDKGVHVIEAASNGNINLDHHGLGDIFNVNSRDSGAIIAGAIDPDNSARASFSDYGSRVTSASWGKYVTTTGYGDLARANENEYYTWQFSGTSSANPIIAGAVASLSSIAKAHGKTVTPRQMRDILHQTGTVLAGNASNEIGTQPDMGRAAEKMLGLDNGGDENTDTAFINALQMAISSTDNGSSVTFHGSVSSDSAATSSPTYHWALPSAAQGSGNGLSSRSFTIDKTSQPQTLSVNVTVKAGTESRVLTQAITVPALSSNASDAPVIRVDRSTLHTVAASTAWSYPVTASSDQDNVSWQWQFISGNSDIRLDNTSQNSTAMRVPANSGNTQAHFRVTATNSSGKSATADVAIIVTQPAAEIVGLKSMDTSSPAKLYTQANFEQADYQWRLLQNGQAVANGIDQSGQISAGLPAGDYVTEVTATSSAQATRTASVTRNLTVTDNSVQNNDAAYIDALMMTMTATDNGSSITFNSMVTSGTSATNTPSFNWTLPSVAEGGSNGVFLQRFTVNKASQPQTLTVSVTVKAGTHSRVLTRTITVPAGEVQNTDAAFINTLKMTLSSTDNGDSITFSSNATSASAATSTPTYHWTLPAGAQGSSNGLPAQSFTINKTSQPQALTVNLAVSAGTQSRDLAQPITIPALSNSADYPMWAYGTAYKTGDIVSHEGKNYQCLVAGWCAQTGQYSRLYYEPGVGLSWSSAWKLHS